MTQNHSNWSYNSPKWWPTQSFDLRGVV